MHFHALLRLDGLDPRDPDAVIRPDPRVGANHLATILRDAVDETRFTTAPPNGSRDSRSRRRKKIDSSMASRWGEVTSRNVD